MICEKDSLTIENKTILIEDNLKLVSFVAKKYLGGNKAYEDLVSIGCLGLIKAVNSFDNSKNIKLSTYAVKCITNEILMYLRKKSTKEICLEYFDENLEKSNLESNIDLVMEEILKSDEKETIKKLIDELPEKHCNLICLRYGIGKNKAHTQKQTALILGVSQSYISVTEKKIIKELKEKLSK